MRISKVRIKNFRNFKSTPYQSFFEVELGDNIILLGENGVGKTNFIDAMRLVLDPSFRPQLGESDFHNGLPRFRGTEIEIQILFTDFMGEKDEKFLSVIPDCIIHDNPPTAQMSFLYCPNDDIDNVQNATNPDFYQTILYGGDGTDRSNLNKEAARRFRKYVQLKVVSALRDIERDMGVWQRSPLRKLTEVMNLIANPRFENVVNQVRRATEDLQNIEPIKDLQNKIQTRLVKMIEGANSFNPQIGLLPPSALVS